MGHNENSNLAFRIFSLWNLIYIVLCTVFFFLLIIASFTKGSIAFFFFAICLLVVAPVGWALNRMFLGLCQDLRLIRQMKAMSIDLPLNSEETDSGLLGEIAREFGEIKKVKDAAGEAALMDALRGTSTDSKFSEDESSLDPDSAFEDPKPLSLLVIAGIVLGLAIVLLIMVIQIFF